jgi:endonuclease/exonuclease/phosphatase family metal-dependent hydrolase
MVDWKAYSPCCFAVVLLGCGGDRDHTAISPVATELSLVTFNVALGVGLSPYLEQRLDSIEADLPGLGADVVCLQELWRPEDIERLSSNLGGEFPYAHWSVQAEGDAEAAGPSCSDAEADVLQTCVEDNCGEVDPAVLPLCAITSCQVTFSEVSTECQQCLASNQSATDIADLTALCAADDAVALSYRDQTGLLLLSRFPLSDTDYLTLDSSLGDRGVLSARLQTSFAGFVDLHCTHLAASIGEELYQGPYGSWEGERLVQVDQMLDHVDARNPDSSPTLLLGDMNCGPPTAQARAASADAFALFDTAGFDAPYVTSDGRCTFCANNPLNDFPGGGEAGVILDHVLVRDLVASTGGARVFDEVIEIDDDGPVQTSRSDHYGVQVVIAPP